MDTKKLIMKGWIEEGHVGCHCLWCSYRNPTRMDSTKEKIIFKGWVEEGEQSSNVPTHCPKCGTKLKKVDSLKYCNILMVYCMNLKCRWVKLFEL